MSMQFEVVFKATNQSFPVSFKNIQEITVIGDAEYYDGSYEVTPQRVDQALQTKGKVLTADVIVKAIPKEYGLVSYNQDKAITVS